jgi:hypothetical protein
MEKLNLKQTIAKRDWLNGQQCLGMAWYGLRASRTPPGEADLFRMEQGQEIGNLARGLYPDGILVSRSNGKEPTTITRELFTTATVATVLEAAVQAGPFVARADILTREGSGWHLLEVKSSFSDTKNLAGLVDDLAYTVMVFRRAGVQIVKASLVLLSRNYRFGDATSRLFETIDKTSEVQDRAEEFDANADSVARILSEEARPAVAPVSACRDCESYQRECLGSGVAHTVLEIPKLHHTKLRRLSQEGIVDISQVPNDLKLTENQRRAMTAMLSGKAVVEPDLSEALNCIQWPVHYLDFETVATVLPLYPGHGCHRQVVTQFSIHHRESIHAEPSHSEYLADPAKDCERELAESLIESLGARGSIIMYSPFEKTRIRALIDLFPDLQAALQAILDRLVDFERIIEGNIYHPEFRGSFSVKTVLPAVVPELSYAGLDVKDGGTAIARFARMAAGDMPSCEALATRRRLLEYCKMDTFAMLKLHETLDRLSAE